MTRKCFFVDRVDPEQPLVTLDPAGSRHIESVLRLKAGEAIELRDGRGGGWHGLIEATGGRAVRVRLQSALESARESRLELSLGLAFAQADRMDLVIRQATELGVQRIVAFRAERSQYGISEAQAGKRADRWGKIIRDALCQCGRTRLPELEIVPDAQALLAHLEHWQPQDGGSLRLVADEEEDRRDLLALWQAEPHCRRLFSLIGPEGGWTASEVAQFQSSGFIPVHLGPRVLRLETAAVAFLALSQLLWGDFSQSVEGRKMP